MKFRKKLIKGLAMSMAFSMLFTTNVFATPIDLANSKMDVKTDTLDKSTGTDYFADEENEWLDGTINEEVRVTVDLASQFEITIPKEIVLDGETGKADYKVKAVGDIAGDQKLSVIPDPNFILSEAGGKADVTATVTQADTEYIYTDLQGDGTEYDGSIATTLTAGEWSGKFKFNITFNGGKINEGSSSELPEVKATLNDYTWEEISVISASGEAQTTYGFKVGDTKEMTLSNGETYNAEIIGFNHDDLADGTGKAGITFQFKELMTTMHNMNSASEEYAYGDNIGGWEASEMREYLNDNEEGTVDSVLDLLPAELTPELKDVVKISDTGNMNTSTLISTVDKLFLLSLEEVGLFYDNAVTGQGTQYEKFADSNSRIKYLDNIDTDWWLRSAHTSEIYSFFLISGGKGYGNGAGFNYGVAPAFCI